MNKFNVIVVMNEAMIKTLKDKNRNYQNNLKVQEYLTDESIFFKISKAKAYNILETVGVRNEALDDVYNSLIAPSVFYDLLSKGKIKEEDNDLIIKYKSYNPNDMFKKGNQE